MIEDKQIKEYRCAKCNKNPVELKREGSVLMNYKGLWLCAGDYLKVAEKERAEFRKFALQE